MSIKCIVLDLDRTTLDREGKLSAQNRRTLEELIAKGIEVVIASGRAYATLPADVMSVMGIRYAICCNGATVYDVTTGKCLRRYGLPADVLESVLTATTDEIVSYEGFIDGIAYAGREYIENPVKYGASPQAVAYVQATRHMQEDIAAFLLANKNRLDSMDVIVRDQESKDRIWEKIRNTTKEVYITSSVGQLIEIAHQNAGKKAGTEFVAEQLGLMREEIAAFGDADNDIDMLQYAGVGIAMENASEGCKAAADYITKHHAEDGVTYGVRKILKLLP